VITPSSLHYVATTRGSYLPDIDPKQHTLTIHGLVDRPLTLTMDELKRFPSVTRLHFIECAGNRHDGQQKTVQESHGMTSCSEWTGVLLSTLLKECGLKGSAKWFVAEGAEEVKGASSIPIAKGMDDCLIAYGQNGEPLRPQQGFPVRIMVPGFEGIYHTKFLRRIKLVDRFYMNYNEFGHLRPEAKELALGEQIGPKSVITYPSGSQQLPSRPWKFPPMAGRSGTARSSRTLHNAWRTSDSATSGDGMEVRPKSCRAASTRSGSGSRCGRRSPIGGRYRSSGTTGCPGWITA
jgi:sulfane dehydrogenase subunit SoxC